MAAGAYKAKITIHQPRNTATADERRVGATSNVELHHYVPQFHLRRFTGPDGRLFLWNNQADRIFRSKPRSIAAERNFYKIPEFADHGHDPMTMERQLSALEGDVAQITDEWLGTLRNMNPTDELVISPAGRADVALYIALQFLRTADARHTLRAFAEGSDEAAALSAEELRRSHISLLWNDKVFQSLADHIEQATWIFGRNQTSTPFITSDNPVAFRTIDHRMWLKAFIKSPSVYLVFPLTPDIILYCFPQNPETHGLTKFANSLSPVEFTDEMVRSENTGQVFMASRFIISPQDSFEFEKAFFETIGTDFYKPRD